MNLLTSVIGLFLATLLLLKQGHLCNGATYQDIRKIQEDIFDINANILELKREMHQGRVYRDEFITNLRTTNSQCSERCTGALQNAGSNSKKIAYTPNISKSVMMNLIRSLQRGLQDEKEMRIDMALEMKKKNQELEEMKVQVQKIQEIKNGNQLQSKKEGMVLADAFCDQPSPPTYGEVFMTDNSVRIGSHIKYSCEEGYIINPNTSQFAVCTAEGHWSEPKPECTEPCLVSPLDNGVLFIKNGWNRYWKPVSMVQDVSTGTALKFNCNNEYERFAGSYVPHGFLTCRKGLLHPGIPECRQKRCYTGNPEFAEYLKGGRKLPQYSNIDSGSDIIVRCPEGMELFRSGRYLGRRQESISCIMGIWSPTLPICSRRSKTCLSNIPGKFLSDPSAIKTEYQSGDQIVVKCDHHSDISSYFDFYYYVYSEDTSTHILTCTEGKWIGQYPDCFTNCTRSDDFSTSEPAKLVYILGDVVNVTDCKNKNYLLEGEKTLICMADGTWSGNARCRQKRWDSV